MAYCYLEKANQWNKYSPISPPPVTHLPFLPNPHPSFKMPCNKCGESNFLQENEMHNNIFRNSFLISFFKLFRVEKYSASKRENVHSLCLRRKYFTIFFIIFGVAAHVPYKIDWISIYDICDTFYYYQIELQITFLHILVMNGLLVQTVQFWFIDYKTKSIFQYIFINVHCSQNLIFFTVFSIH